MYSNLSFIVSHLNIRRGKGALLVTCIGTEFSWSTVDISPICEHSYGAPFSMLLEWSSIFLHLRPKRYESCIIIIYLFLYLGKKHSLSTWVEENLSTCTCNYSSFLIKMDKEPINNLAPRVFWCLRGKVTLVTFFLMNTVPLALMTQMMYQKIMLNFPLTQKKK